MDDTCSRHLGQNLLRTCRTGLCSDECCTALALPHAAACSARWAATAREHAARIWALREQRCPSAKCSSPMQCPFAQPEYASTSPCDSPACSDLWAHGELDGPCQAAIVAHCTRPNATMSRGCSWYAAARSACHDRVRPPVSVAGNTSSLRWFMCAQAAQRGDSLIDEALGAHALATRTGRSYVTAEAYQWTRPGKGFGCTQYGTTTYSKCPPVVAFSLEKYAPGMLEITVSAGVFDLPAAPDVQPINIVVIVLCVAVLVFGAVFDYAIHRSSHH